MATEQDWGAYADQSFLAWTDSILARTGAGAGVEVPGTHLVARKAASQPHEAYGGGSAAGIRLRSSDYGVSWDMIVGNANEMQFKHNAGSSLDFVFRSGRVCLIDDFTFGVRWSMDCGSANELRFSNNAGSPLEYVFANGHVRPGTDNNRNLGSASYRWSVVYSGTGTINTSDEREKVWRGALDAAEMRAANRIIGEMGFFQWADAVAEKGEDGARYHFGVKAQAVWSIMADEGLVDPIGKDGRPGKASYAFLCFDEWPGQASRKGDQGGKETVQETAPGNRFGLRIDQLTLFLIAALNARLSALESA